VRVAREVGTGLRRGKRAGADHKMRGWLGKLAPGSGGAIGPELAAWSEPFRRFCMQRTAGIRAGKSRTRGYLYIPEPGTYHFLHGYLLSLWAEKIAMVSVNQVAVRFGGFELFGDISFQINPRDRIGLVGKNGAGKTTLLKLIKGLISPEKGEVVMPDDLNTGYLPQQMVHRDGKTVLDETLSAFSEVLGLEKEMDRINHQLAVRQDHESDDYLRLIARLAEASERYQLIGGGTIHAEVERTLGGLGFSPADLSRMTSEFSGGWRMRIELAKLLLQKPDLFLLDEPTNHLDIESIQWLEDFLMNYPGAVVLISHDRAFLDNITNRTIEISLGRAYDYQASYSRYVELRKERREQQLAAYRNQQKMIGDTEEFIERFRYKATKAVQVQSRIRQLEKLELIEVDEEDLGKINVRFAPAPRAGSIVAEIKDLSKSYGSNLVLDRVSMVLERNEKVAFVGRNGEGKTTLSRILTGELEYEGDIKMGHNVRIGYFAQNQDELLDDEKTVFQTIDDIATGDIRTKIRNILGAFLFSGDTVDKKVRVLSGGERSRLAIAKLLLEPFNLLVLDEPTNHLDMHSKDVLKQALVKYDGTLVIVSHDREFLDGLVGKVYEFRDRKLMENIGGIYDFLERKKLDSLKSLEKAPESLSRVNNKELKTGSDAKESWEKRKVFEKEIRKLENQVKRAEEDISELDKEIARMDILLESPDKNTLMGLDQDFFSRYERHKARLSREMDRWEKLVGELERKKK
jgi:ATP-binding cassette, subfamily F, member 3